MLFVFQPSDPVPQSWAPGVAPAK